MSRINSSDPYVSIMNYLLKRRLSSNMFGNFNVVETAKDIFAALDSSGYITLQDVNRIIYEHDQDRKTDEDYLKFGGYTYWYDQGES